MARSSIGLKAVIPRSMPRAEDFIQETAKAVRTTGEEMKSDLEKTVETWRVRPEFLLVVRVRDAQALVLTNSELWEWINQGVPARIITAKNAPTLRFLRDHTPKTDVKVLGSKAGAKYGPEIKKKSVNWPGIEARKWDEAIAEKYQKRFQARVNIGMANAARKSHRR